MHAEAKRGSIMATFHDVFDPIIGPLVPVRFDITHSERRKRWKLRQPVLHAIDTMALVDTGAECSCITVSLADKLALPLATINFVNMPSTFGLVPALFREAELTLCNQGRDPLQSRIWPILHVMEIDLVKLGYEAIVGRDLLANCEFIYNGNNSTFSLSY
jgi:hypothetical protein